MTRLPSEQTFIRDDLKAFADKGDDGWKSDCKFFREEAIWLETVLSFTRDLAPSRYKASSTQN
jgi:hypothetical protein